METTLTKVTVPTVVLRDLVSRAAKCSTNVDMIPLSSLMQIVVKDGKMYVRTTDNINFVTTFSDVTADNFDIMVQTKLFSQLVSKITSENTTFTIEDNKLTVLGNGRHNVALMTDTDGSVIKFPVVEVTPVGTTYHLKSEEVRSILSLNKSCKSEKNEIPAHACNYYADSNRVLTTNYYKACSNPIKLSDHPIMISSTVMDLVSSVMDEEGVDVYQDADYIVFESTKGKLVGKKVSEEELSELPAEKLIEKIETELAYSVTMNRTLFVQAVDRMCLFVDTFEQNRLTLTFTANGLNLYSNKTDSSEELNYVSVITPITSDVKFSVDAQFLKSELSACDREDLTIRFSDDTGLQIHCGDVALILGRLNETEEIG